MDLQQPLYQRDGETGGRTLSPHQEVEFPQGVVNGTLFVHQTHISEGLNDQQCTNPWCFSSISRKQANDKSICGLACRALLRVGFPATLDLVPTLHTLYLQGWNVHALPSPLPIQKGMTPFPKGIRSELCTKQHCAVLQREAKGILRYEALQWWDCDNPHKKCEQADQEAPLPQLPPAQLEQDMPHFLPAEPGPWDRFHSWMPGACKAQTTVKSQQYFEMSLPITFKLF